MVGVEEGREFRFRGDLYSQESTFPLPLVLICAYFMCVLWVAEIKYTYMHMYVITATPVDSREQKCADTNTGHQLLPH